MCLVVRGGEGKEQKKGKAWGNILLVSMHSLSIFLQASHNREASLDAAGCKACH